MAGCNVVGLVLVVAVFVASALAAPQWPLQWYLHLPQTTHESKEKNKNLNTHSFEPHETAVEFNVLLFLFFIFILILLWW
jgi:hypothetical protein